MITFQKIKYDDIPEAIVKRVISWSDKEITIDDTGLTAGQIQKLKDYFLQEGYKEI